jgi:heat shock protein HtpX
MVARRDLLAQIAANRRRTVGLMAGFTIFVVAVAAVLDLAVAGGPIVIAVAVVVAVAMVWTGYFYSDRLAIAAARGREADPVAYPRLHNLVEELCLGVGLPKPRIYVVDDPAPNAFATGRNPTHAAIAVTTGLLAMMNRDELEGVLAHELSHIHNYDILVGTIAVTLVGFVALMADFGLRLLLFGGVTGRRRDNRDGGQIYVLALSIVFIILAPIAAKAMQLAISRRREALADVSGVLITRNPQRAHRPPGEAARQHGGRRPRAGGHRTPVDRVTAGRPFTRGPRLVQPALRDPPPDRAADRRTPRDRRHRSGTTPPAHLSGPSDPTPCLASRGRSGTRRSASGTLALPLRTRGR